MRTWIVIVLTEIARQATGQIVNRLAGQALGRKRHKRRKKRKKRR